MIGVYKITNIVNNKIYVGSSVNIDKRFNTHKTDLNNKSHHNIKLQRAWNKYGSDSFKFEVTCLVDDILIARIIEQNLINDLIQNESYNISKNANGASFGEDNPAKRKEVRQKITDALTGRKLSNKAIENIANAVTLRWADVGYKQKMHAIRKQLWQTDEYKSNVIKARKVSMDLTTKEERQLRYGHLLGTKNTEETKRLKSIAVKARWADPQEAEKLKLSMKGKKINVHCPYCAKYGGISNMKRYHFDKCKNK